MSNNKMLIDAGHPEETRVVMVRGNRVDEFDFESEHKTQLRGNIYLAKVTRVEPSLQAAFVDYGGNRHGFLAFSEIHPDYYQIPVADRQALLDAEAEDAREAAAAEALQDQDDLDASEGEAEAKEKPARKRRSRRRSKSDKDNLAADSDDNAESNEASGDEDVEEAVAEAPKPRKTRSRRTTKAKKADDSADEAPEEASESDEVAEIETSAETADQSPSDANATAEESDDDASSIAAENDGDDVVSEPAKPARKTTRRPRKKKVEDDVAEVTASADSDAASAEAASQEQAAVEPAKPKRRRTSRKKADVETSVEEASAETTPAEPADPATAPETVAEADDSKAEKPKRRRTSRKKKPVSDDAVEVTEQVVAEAAAEATTAEAGETAETEESKPRKTRSRGRSRRRKNNDDSDSAETTAKGIDNDSDNGESVEQLGSEDALEEVPTRRAPRRHYKIQEVIKRRQILLVQVVKEERGNKGAALTTYLSLAGRYSVLMPNTARGGGISRKITNAADRKRLKSVAANLEVPQGMGVILRTAGASRKPEDIQRDFEYLMRLWENVRSLTLESTAPYLVYEEGSLIKRSIRDLYDKDTGEILVAGEAGYREAKDFMTMLMPNHAKNVKQYRDRIPMFARMGVEAQLDAMLQPEVTLRSGGYIIIDQTEALVAIDVNSGRSTRQHSIEETAVQTNLEAADEVARQLRLRDLAGLIVIDFIDMEDKRNIRSVEKRLKDALKEDRARIQVGRISHFGLMEMSRQRIRASVLESTTQACPTCDGLGHVRAASSVAISILRSIEEHLNRNSRNNLTVKVSSETALYLLNNKRENLGDLETRFGVTLSIATDDSLGNTPCAIEKGEVSNRRPVQEAAVQPDSIELTEDEAAVEPVAASAQEPAAAEGEVNGTGKKRRRRRRRRKGGGDDANQADSEAQSAEPAEQAEATAEDTSSEAQAVNGEAVAEVTAEVTSPSDEDDKPARTRRPRRSRAKKSDDEAAETTPEDAPADAISEDSVNSDVEAAEQPAKKSTRTRRKKAVKKAVDEDAVSSQASPESPPVAESAGEAGEQEPDKPKRRTTRRKKEEEPTSEDASPMIETAQAEIAEAPMEPTEAVVAEADPKKGGWWQRKFF